ARVLDHRGEELTVRAEPAPRVLLPAVLRRDPVALRAQRRPRLVRLALAAQDLRLDRLDGRAAVDPVVDGLRVDLVVAAERTDLLAALLLGRIHCGPLVQDRRVPVLLGHGFLAGPWGRLCWGILGSVRGGPLRRDSLRRWFVLRCGVLLLGLDGRVAVSLRLGRGR